jgi:hypothetical protein
MVREVALPFVDMAPPFTAVHDESMYRELSNTTVGPPDSRKAGHPFRPVGQLVCDGSSRMTE